MIAKVLTAKNLTMARTKVLANKGSSGIDGMQTSELREFIRIHRSTICNQILKRSYQPKANKGVEIPKPNGKTRLLGVPTVVDRWLQQAVSQQLAIYFKLDFEEES